MKPVPDPDEIVTAFLAHWFGPTQRQLDMLLHKLDVPIKALMHDSDGAGYPMGMLRVERGQRTFEFSDDPDIKPVCGFLAWDTGGDAQDIVAWSPRDNWTGSWLGRCIVLNEHEVTWPRMGDPLPVHLDVLPWLQASRSGCVIVDRKRARFVLKGVKLAADSVEDGLVLRRILSTPDPRIVVPARTVELEAA